MESVEWDTSDVDEKSDKVEDGSNEDVDDEIKSVVDVVVSMSDSDEVCIFFVVVSNMKSGVVLVESNASEDSDVNESVDIKPMFSGLVEYIAEVVEIKLSEDCVLESLYSIVEVESGFTEESDDGDVVFSASELLLVSAGFTDEPIQDSLEQQFVEIYDITLIII